MLYHSWYNNIFVSTVTRRLSRRDICGGNLKFGRCVQIRACVCVCASVSVCIHSILCICTRVGVYN